MSQSSTLTVVVPRILERLERTDSADSLLTYLAGRGDIARRWPSSDAAQARLRPWQRGVLATLGLDEKNFPSAPVSALGEQFDQRCRDWLHADPIHLAAGLNEVALVSLPAPLQLTREEHTAMTAALAQHLTAEGFVLKTSQGAWLIGSTRALDVTTVTEAFARTHEWSDVLPQGPDAPSLRRLMTELQMVVHDHPVNEARSARGVPTVNSLWLWGSGPTRPVHSAATATCIGDHPYLRGVCRSNDWPLPEAAESAQDVLAIAERSGSALFVAGDLTVDAFEARWLAPFVAALKNDRTDRLELILDEWLLTIDRWRLRRFWRRSLPLPAWAVA